MCRSQIIRWRESLVLYKSVKIIQYTLCWTPHRCSPGEGGDDFVGEGVLLLPQVQGGQAADAQGQLEQGQGMQHLLWKGAPTAQLQEGREGGGMAL
jgi:hypothetical protein